VTDCDPLDQVGYAKPPKRTRFTKGVSGNPLGRPRGRPNLATVLQRILQEKVVINENGIRRTVSKLEAAVKQMVNKAASGDLPAMRQLAAIIGSAEIETVEGQKKPDLSDSDLKVMSGILKRIQQSGKGEEDGNAK
jgi:hypothetical protein